MKISVLLKKVFNCHQIPERSFFIRGRQFPLCARCTGILAGIILFPIFIIIDIQPPFYLMLPLIIDGSIQLFYCIMSNNLRRFLTGILFSFGFLGTVVSIVKLIIKMLG